MIAFKIKIKKPVKFIRRDPIEIGLKIRLYLYNKNKRKYTAYYDAYVTDIKDEKTIDVMYSWFSPLHGKRRLELENVKFRSLNNDKEPYWDYRNDKNKEKHRQST